MMTTEKSNQFQEFFKYVFGPKAKPRPIIFLQIRLKNQTEIKWRKTEKKGCNNQQEPL
jgi:hypothetical protein